MNYTQSEGTAARRRFSLYLVDATDGITPETGEAAGQPQISKAGGAWANTTATLTALGNGGYYVELTAAELDTLGVIAVRYKSANTAEFQAPAMVVAHNQHDAVRLGLTALPNAAVSGVGGLVTAPTTANTALADVTRLLGTAWLAPGTAGTPDVNAKLIGAAPVTATTSVTIPAASTLATTTGAVGSVTAGVTVTTNNDKTGYGLSAAAVQAIWDALTSALTTVGSIGKKLADWTIHSAADVWAAATRTLTAGTNIALAKGTGVTGFTDLSAADVRTALGLASANLDTQLDELPTNAELATALAAADDAVLAAIAALNNLSSAQAQTAAAAALTAYDPPTHAELTAGLASADDATLAAIAALNNLSAAQVNAEVVDALRTDTGTEVSAVPAAAAAISAQIQFMYQALRNKVLSGASLRIHNDAGTIVATKTQTDNGSTYTEEKAT